MGVFPPSVEKGLGFGRSCISHCHAPGERGGGSRCTGMCKENDAQWKLRVS